MSPLLLQYVQNPPAYTVFAVPTVEECTRLFAIVSKENVDPLKFATEIVI